MTILLALLFGGLGYVVIERQSRRARARREASASTAQTQAEFAETIQIMRDEGEAHALVKHHLEREIRRRHGDRAGAQQLRRPAGGRDARATTTPSWPAGLVDAAPESCLAVRLARPYEQGDAIAPLLPCKLCGKSAAEVTCVPSLVSGEVIGSVLIQGDRPLDAGRARARRRLHRAGRRPCWPTCATWPSPRRARPRTP